MSKKKSIVVLILSLVMTVLLGCVVTLGVDRGHAGSIRNIKTGLDLSGGVSITYEAVSDNPSDEEMSDTMNKLRQRVEQYSTEAQVSRQGKKRINIEIPGVTNANEILEELGQPGSLYFVNKDSKVVLSGTDVKYAEGGSYRDRTTGKTKYVVSLKMTKEGTKKFAEATKENVGKPIYIVYNNQIISAPTVNSEITDGSAEISGMGSLEEANALASNIRIGGLSLELKEVYSNVVGAQLGQEALKTSLIAGMIGVAIIIVLMIIVFRVSGIAAGWALIVFTLLDLLALNALDVTLTLPGIAGVILTIGMAVDANIIIYTRTKEEIALGAKVPDAIESGFRKAFSAILDGNVTTLIAAAVLFVLGSGSIRGFAETLAIGVILSMFSALVVSKVISRAFVGLGIRSEKYYGKKTKRKPIGFVKKRAFAFAIALLMIVSVPAGMGYFNHTSGSPMNYSLDFVGGTATTVDFGKDMSLKELDKKVEPVVEKVTGNADIQFQKISSTNKVIIKTQDLTVKQRTKLNEALKNKFGVKEEKITAENVSSTISKEMSTNAIKAVAISVILMLIYIWIRFRNVRFASSAVIALIHDIAVVAAFYVWARASVGSTFIAVMLTILGYSINSTIVISDRIRENKNLDKNMDNEMAVNSAVTDTLSRSIYSSLTTLITVSVLFIMGVPAVKEFALPIIIGLIAGTFSSVCVTGPLWYTMNKKRKTVKN